MTSKKCLDSGKYTQQVAADVAAGQKVGVSGTPAVFVNGLSIVGAQPYSVFKQTIDQELATAQVNNENILQKLGDALIVPAFAQTPTDTTTPVATSPTPPARVDVGVGPFPVLGNANAKVTIVEFADFQCPFCAQFYKQTEPSIINDYVKSGKAKFAFQNYAFLGQESNTAAEGAYCANDQGKFWSYHNFMYDHQAQENSGQFTKTNLE
jgi:protein-disulfide isomerase